MDDMMSYERSRDREDHALLPTRAAYDHWAPEYDDADPTTLLDEPFLRERAKLFDGCSLLDLGCGTGRYLRILSLSGVSVAALDLSGAMLARARRGLNPDAGVGWVQGSASRLPFASATFDRVISGLVLDHVKDLSSFFGQVAALLRPRGRVIMSAVHPDMQRLTGSRVRFHSAGREYQTGGTVHEVRAIEKAASDAGLTVECLLEPCVDQELIDRRPAWNDRRGCPALVLLAAEKR